MNNVQRMARPESVVLHYCYRDFGNNKSYGAMLFSNPRRLPVEEIWRQLELAVQKVTLFPDRPLFRPEWVGLPTLYLFNQGGFVRNSDDHDWHELIEVTVNDEGDQHNPKLSVDQFISALTRTH